jgi:hypothetical protein
MASGSKLFLHFLHYFILRVEAPGLKRKIQDDVKDQDKKSERVNQTFLCKSPLSFL